MLLKIYRYSIWIINNLVCAEKKQSIKIWWYLNTYGLEDFKIRILYWISQFILTF